MEKHYIGRLFGVALYAETNDTDELGRVQKSIETAIKLLQLKWRIWSSEHDGWWKVGRRGYTDSVIDAGEYSLEDAVSICRDANVDPSGRPNESILPELTVDEMKRIV